MDNSSRFFANRDCRYYPCHKGIDELNCLFCFCPFYTLVNCPGTPEWLDTSRGKIKDCSACIFPHVPEHYDDIIRLLKDNIRH